MIKGKNKPILIAVAVILTLIAVIVFLFGECFLNTKPHSEESALLDPSVKGNIVLDVPSDPYYYNGSEEFNPLSDVSARDSNGLDLTSAITYSITPSNSRTEKEIIYSVTDKNLRTTTATRTLMLSNYKGPSITVEDEAIKCDISELSKLNDILFNENIVKADDGFGNDISDSLYIERRNDIIESGIYTMSVTAENFLKDSVSDTVKVEVSGSLHENPIILTDDTVVIRRGDRFVPMDYVASAVDSQYGDLTEYVKYRTNLNVNVEGDYYMSFYIDGFEGVSTSSVTLAITVLGTT